MDPLVGLACAQRGPVAYGAGTRGGTEQNTFPFGLRESQLHATRFATCEMCKSYTMCACVCKCMRLMFNYEDWQLCKDHVSTACMYLARISELKRASSLRRNDNDKRSDMGGLRCVPSCDGNAVLCIVRHLTFIRSDLRWYLTGNVC